MDRTTAPGASGGMFVDDNPGLGVTGTLLTAEDLNAHQEEIYGSIVGAGLTPDSADNGQLWDTIRKAIKERSKPIGEIFALLHEQDPVAFGSGTEDTYFPHLCLTTIATVTSISTTNWPDLVPYLRALQTKYKDGISGEKSDFAVTNWAIASNVATLTFTNDADHIAFLTALGEDQAVHGSYTNWRTVTLPSAIGNITAGTYEITAITPASRTLTFAFTAANNSGAGTFTANFYAHRIAGSTTTARVFSANGMMAMGVNDSNAYFMAGAMRRRDYLQGHFHFATLGSAGSDAVSYSQGNSGTPGNNNSLVRGPSTDGTNGTPRTGKTTHGPTMGVHLYIHGGSYES